MIFFDADLIFTREVCSLSMEPRVPEAMNFDIPIR